MKEEFSCEQSVNLGDTDLPNQRSVFSTMQENSSKVPTSSTTPQPHTAQIPTKPNYDLFATISSSHPSSRIPTPAPSTQSRASANPSNLSADPFAALSPPPSQPSPSLNPQRFQLASSTPSSTLIEMASSNNPPSTQQSSLTTQQTNGASADDEWNFSSALPEDSANLPASSNIIVANGQIGIVFTVGRPANNDSLIHILASVSNRSPQLVTEYTCQVAVPKVKKPLKARRSREIADICSALHSAASSTIWTNAAAKPKRRYHAKHRDQWRLKKANQRCEDAVEGIV